MHNVSAMQLLEVWVDLERSLFGEHSYGGDQAEIYLSKVMQRSAMVENYVRGASTPFINEEGEKAFRQARQSLVAIFETFQEMRESRVEIEHKGEWREVGQWFVKERYEHRIHVRVVPSEALFERMKVMWERRMKGSR